MFIPPGCVVAQGGADLAPSAKAGGAGVYFKDRGNDFVDIFGLSFTFGIGVLANVRATQIVQAGGLWFNGSRAGFVGREYGTWSESSIEMGFPGMYLRDLQLVPQSGSAKLVNTARGQSWFFQFCGEEGVPYDEGYDRKFWQVGATVHAGVVGVDFSINLAEFLDFLLGWFALDISRDDTANRPPEKKEADRPPVPPVP
jgi:hypothetical protein